MKGSSPMTKFIKVIAAVALAAIGQTLFAYNGGYENSLTTDTVIGGVTYKGYGNNTVTKRTESGTTIAANAYAQCKKLTSVSLAGVTSLGNAAFAYSALTSVELPATLKTIGYIPFGGCKSLASVTINSTAFMTSADEAKEPFRDCTALKTVTAKCAPPSWDFKKVFPSVTSVKVSQANLSAWQAKKYSGVTVDSLPKYTIRFNMNDGSGLRTTRNFEYGVTIPLPYAQGGLGWSRNGYAFKGWSLSAGSAKVDISNGGNVTKLTDPGKMVDLYAVWQLAAGYCEITFHSNDTTDRIRTIAHKVGVKENLPYALGGLGWERGAGYGFKGWSLSAASATVTYANGAAVTNPIEAGKAIHLYGVWQLAAGYCEITFHSNDTTDRIRTVAHKVGVKENLPYALGGLGWENPGYGFKGWSLSAASATVTYANGAAVTNPIEAGKAIHLYGVWQLAAGYCEITFHSNDGTGRTRTIAHKVGVKENLPYALGGLGWERTGYGFKGWSLSAASATVTYANGAAVTNPIEAGKVIHLYAVWMKSGSEMRKESSVSHTPESLLREVVVYALSGESYVAHVMLTSPDADGIYNAMAYVETDDGLTVAIGEGCVTANGDLKLELDCDGESLSR